MIVFEDEASFRQTPTLHQTWAPRRAQPQIPTRGQRHTQKILGAVAIGEPRFVYRHQQDSFNTATYGAFVDDVVLPKFYRRGHRVFLVQDNASYHTQPEMEAWYQSQSRRLVVCPLPKYSPKFNAVERIWWLTRKEATHNQYFPTVEALLASLFTFFDDLQQWPALMVGLVQPYL